MEWSKCTALWSKFWYRHRISITPFIQHVFLFWFCFFNFNFYIFSVLFFRFFLLFFKHLFLFHENGTFGISMNSLHLLTAITAVATFKCNSMHSTNLLHTLFCLNDLKNWARTVHTIFHNLRLMGKLPGLVPSWVYETDKILDMCARLLPAYSRLHGYCVIFFKNSPTMHFHLDYFMNAHLPMPCALH